MSGSSFTIKNALSATAEGAFSHTSDMLMLTKLRFCTIINIYKTGINADIHGDINRGLNHGSTVTCR